MQNMTVTRGWAMITLKCKHHMPDVVLDVTLTRARTSLVGDFGGKDPCRTDLLLGCSQINESVDFDVHAESGFRQKWHSEHLLT